MDNLAAIKLCFHKLEDILVRVSSSCNRLNWGARDERGKRRGFETKLLVRKKIIINFNINGDYISVLHFSERKGLGRETEWPWQVPEYQ